MQAGDKIIFLRSFMKCRTGDQGTVTHAERKSIAGTVYQELEIKTAHGPVNMAYNRQARVPTIALAPKQI
jgi:hypothetical protein